MKKVLSFVLVLSMVLGSVSMAFATTDNKVAKVPSVAAENAFVAELTIAPTDNNGIPANEPQKVKFTLENGYWAENATITTAAVSVTSPDSIGVVPSIPVSASTVAAVATGDDYAEISFEYDTTITKNDHITFYFQVAGEDEGEVKVHIDGLDSRVSDGTYTLAVVGDDNTVTKVGEKAKQTGRSMNVQGARIEVRETAVNSVQGNQAIKLTLPKGFAWNATSMTASAIAGDMVNTVTNVTVGGVDNRDVEIAFTVNNNNNVREVLVITPYFNVTKNAKLGDVEVQLRPMSKIAATTDIDAETGLVIAKYLEEGVIVSTVAEEDLPEIVAGRLLNDGTDSGDNYIVEITLEETQDKSLIPGKHVDFTFPEYVHIANGANITVEQDFVGGNDTSTAALCSPVVGTRDADDNSFEWEVPDGNNTAFTANDGKANTVTFFVPVTVEAGTQAGDIEVVVTGAKAGVDETKLVVGKVIAPITVEYTLSDVKTGVQNQAVADITIKENVIGALCDETGFNTITVKLDENGQNFGFSTAVAEVVAGDLEIREEVDKELADNGVITFHIERASIKTLGEIKISGLEVTMDRTPAEGKYAVLVGGNALVTNGDHDGFDGRDGDFSNWAVAADYINVVTPADQGVNATFKIGESKYTVNGVEVAMDAPSYVDDNNRTMVSIRYVANALGVSDNKIIWNEDAQTATIFGKSTVVVKIGENQITVNGSVIPMDTQAVNKAGRIYVPLRYIANALGAAVEWDQAAQTATIITLANN